MNNNNNIGWLFLGGYKNILPSMLTILPSSSTRAILLTSLAIYFCIPLKAIQYYIIIQYSRDILFLISLLCIPICQIPCHFGGEKYHWKHLVLGDTTQKDFPYIDLFTTDFHLPHRKWFRHIRIWSLWYESILQLLYWNANKCHTQGF